MPKGFENRLATISGIQFTVNTSVTDATLSLTGGGPASLGVSSSLRYIQFGDNCIIKGFGLTFPYQFGQGIIFDAPMHLTLKWIDSTGLNTDFVNEVGNGGRLNISDPNYWYDMDVFIPQPTTATAKWRFEISSIVGRVSQINAPAALNTLDLFCTFHLLIQTTLPLIG